MDQDRSQTQGKGFKSRRKKIAEELKKDSLQTNGV